MARALFTFVMVLVLLMRAPSLTPEMDPEIPRAAQTTIGEDFREWIHPPQWSGACAEMSVVKVTWMQPRGVAGVQPVLWVKDTGKIGAILGLSYSDLRYIERSVWAQPVIVLRDVSILRPCAAPPQPSDLDDLSEYAEGGTP